MKFAMEISEQTLKHESVQQLLSSNEKFDLVIMESFMNEAHLGFGHLYKAPIIVLSPIGANLFVNQLTRNPSPTSYVSEPILGYSSPMSFLQRLTNFLVRKYMFPIHDLLRFIFFSLKVSSIMEAMSEFIRLKKQNEVLHQYFPDAPELKELYNRVALVLLNSHVSTFAPKPLMPNMIEVGGFHIADVKELPKVGTSVFFLPKPFD